jgi:hypothetical protein
MEKKVKMGKTIIQLEGGNKIRRQSCKVGRQTCADKMKKKSFLTWKK